MTPATSSKSADDLLNISQLSMTLWMVIKSSSSKPIVVFVFWLKNWSVVVFVCARFWICEIRVKGRESEKRWLHDYFEFSLEPKSSFLWLESGGTQGRPEKRPLRTFHVSLQMQCCCQWIAGTNQLKVLRSVRQRTHVNDTGVKLEVLTTVGHVNRSTKA